MDINKIEQQREHFNSISERYFNYRQSSNHLYYKIILWDYVLKKLNLNKYSSPRVLEPMCGYSEGYKILKPYLSKNFSYEGFDYSEEILEKAHLANPNLKIFQQDITKFKSTNKYELIILIGGLHHVPKFLDSSLDCLYECLDDHGYFINFEPTHNSWINQKIRENIYKSNSLFDDETEEGFIFNNLNKSYTRSGFKIEKQYYCGLLAYIFYYNPDAFPFLNKGNQSIVKILFFIDKLFINTFIGKYFSFATISVLRK